MANVINQVITEKYALYNGDCIDVMSGLPDESIHLSVYSPPFSDLYTYSSDIRDLSNCDSYEDFLKHYDFVVKEISRITKKGRCTAVHCCDIPTSNTGKDAMIDFAGDIIRTHQKNGFDYIARHAIWKEPLKVRNRTMAKTLTHKTIVTDSIYAGVAGADYILVFRKKGENETPVSNPNGFLMYFGDEKMPEDIHKYMNYNGDQKKNSYSHWIWQKYASSFWYDIRIDNILPFEDCRDDNDEKHATPTQLDPIYRIIQMRSNPGEIVFTPFAGAGTEVFCAVELGRKGIGAELKESYFRQCVKNLEKCKLITEEKEQPKLF